MLLKPIIYIHFKPINHQINIVEYLVNIYFDSVI